MTLKDFQFNNTNHFVAMEYYALILNRTYLVLITKEYLIGLKVNGLAGVETKEGIVSKWVSSKIAIKGDLNNYWSYVKPKYLETYENLNLFDGSILKADRANFIVKRNEITEVSYNSSKKWGMGYYPHDGKVYISYSKARKREFIILGDQSGKKIADMIYF
ncbi:MAG: hypothetical protein K2X48_14345 [Chitinophagaceae bacterium]|nr:hypothetical protein [Chitinophagaceae bacterium]